MAGQGEKNGSRNCCLTAVRHVFGLFGSAVGRMPAVFLVVSLVLALALCGGLYKAKMHDDISFGYTPPNAPSHHEFDVYREYFDVEKGPFGMAIFVQAKDGGSLTRPDPFNATIDLRQLVTYDFAIDAPGVKNYTYTMSCEPRCKLNIAVGAFKKAIWEQWWRIADGTRLSTNFDLDYPRINYMNTLIDLSNNMFGVESNYSARPYIGTSVEMADLIVLWYLADKGNETMEQALNLWQLKLYDHVQNMSNPYITATVYGEAVAKREAMQGARKVAPFFLGGFVAMIVWVLVVVCVSSAYYTRMNCFKILMGLMAVLTPLFSSLAALGLMSWCGLTLQALVLTIPIMILAIGLHSSFLLMHSQQQLGQNEDTSNLTCTQQTSLVFQQTAPSIALSHLSSALAFAVLTITPLPQVQSLCLAACLACLLSFLFQLTLFAPVLALCSCSKASSELNCPDLGTALRRFLWCYAGFLATCKAWILAVILVALCWGAGVYGIYQLQPYYAPQKAFSEDSPLYKAALLSSERVSHEHQLTSIFVNKAPVLGNETEYGRFKEMVKEIENLPNGLGPNFTTNWLRVYEPWAVAQKEPDWMGFVDETPVNYNDVPFFMERAQAKLLRNLVKFRVVNLETGNKGAEIDAFYMLFAYQNMSCWRARVEKATKIRQILANYPEFNATMWEMDLGLYDYSLVAKRWALAAIMVAVVAMAIVSFIFFVPSFCSILLVLVTAASISVGTMGLMSLLGISLDPFSQLNLLVSIGYALDLGTHMVYQFHNSGSQKHASKPRRIHMALLHCAPALIETSVGLLLCICLLCMGNIYIFVVLGKTVFLSVILGLVFGLFVVPTVLGAMPPGCTGGEGSDEGEDGHPLKQMEHV